MSFPIDSLAAAADGTVRIDADILRLVVEGLDACATLPLDPTPQQRGSAIGRADYAYTRLQLWLRDCADVRQVEEAAC